MKKIFIMTGEHSGDIHAAKVVSELKKLVPDIEIEGIGGVNLQNAGVKLFSDHKKMSAMGFSARIILDHFTLGKRLVDYLKKEYKPDLVLMVDYGAFNLNVAKVLKSGKNTNLKIFYYIPPQVWASRKWRINVIKKYVDKVLCIFPFEKDMYEEHGIDVHYCGHPLIYQLPEKADKIEFFERHGLDKSKKLVSIFPGSRVFELKNLMKIFIKSAEILNKKYPNVQFLVSQAPNLSDEVYSKFFSKTKTNFNVVKGENHAMLSVSDALILASGTVALEACLYQTPMIIAYKGPWILYLIYLLVRCLDKVSLPNIILDKMIVPELIQQNLSISKIVSNIEKILFDDDYRISYINDLREVSDKMSDKNSSFEVAIQIEKYFS